MVAQLSFFAHGSRRFKGSARSWPAPEFKTHVMVADVIRKWIRPGWRWSHLPFGEHRTEATGRRLKRMGVTRGWPDFVFVHEHGRVCWLELKRHGAILTDEQAALGAFLRTAGHDFEVARGFDQAVAALVRWGVVVGIRT